MSKFWLIQRGIFEDTGKSLIGSDGVVDLSYMGFAEFEWNAIPKAYRRMMYHFTEYEVFHTEIYTPEHDELLLFCKKDRSTELLQAIREFIEHPYSLKEFSELEKVPRSKKGENSFFRRRTNFWWCIDIKESGDWMAFLQPQFNLFKDAIENDYKNWWMNKTPEEREEEYQKSLHW